MLKYLPEEHFLAHKIMHQNVGNETKPIGLHQITCYDFTSSFFWDRSGKKEKYQNHWILVSTES